MLIYKDKTQLQANNSTVTDGTYGFVQRDVPTEFAN
jgi:hypothetical protein